MAGLMDFFGQSEDPNSAAMMQMAAALLAARDQPGATLGGALGRGLLSGMQGYGQAKSAAEQRKRRQMEMEDYEQARADKQAARESAKQFQELQRQAFTPQMTFDTSKIMGNDYGSIATSSKPVSMQQGLENLRGLLAQSGNVQDAMEVEKQLRDMRPKVKDYREIRGEGGSAQIVGFDEYGQPVMTGQTPWKAPERLDLGGRIAMLDPATMKTIQQYQKTLTPGEQSSASLGWANVGLRGQELSRQSKRDLAEDAYRQAALQTKPVTANVAAKDAREALQIIDQARPLINKATGSGMGAATDAVMNFMGVSTESGQAAAQLRALEGALISKMPKMTGPQSDKDVAMYRQMAGEIGDPMKPAKNKEAALQVIEQLQRKYLQNATQGLAPAAPSGGIKFLGFE
jgi:hypothetical protein